MSQKRKPHLRSRPVLAASTRRAKKVKQPRQIPEFESVLLVPAKGRAHMVKRVWGS